MTSRPTDLEKLSDIEMLSKTVKYAGLGGLSKESQDYLRQKLARGSARSGNGAAIAAFYDRHDRPAPSLPKLKFLEGKE